MLNESDKFVVGGYYCMVWCFSEFTDRTHSTSLHFLIPFDSFTNTCGIAGSLEY